MIQTSQWWRLADPYYGDTAQTLLSGRGAFLYGGRWNSPGRACVYLGESVAQAAMELLVHLEEKPILDAYVCMAVQVPDDELLVVPYDTLPIGWDAHEINPPAQSVGDAWLDSGASLGLVVPSVACPGGYNLLLNPAHTSIDTITTEPAVPYTFDERIRQFFT